jgi:hypothetical protein
MIVLAWPSAVAGQKRAFPRVNFEFGGGMNFGATKDGWQEVKQGPSLFIEGRYNIDELPLDVGLQIDISAFRRETGIDYTQPRSWKFMLVSDYASRRARLVCPFAGVGIGIATDDNLASNLSPGTALCLMPRVGVRLLKHVSLTLDYEISHVSHNHFDLKIGFYL